MVGIAGFEPAIMDSESTALPLGDIPKLLLILWNNNNFY